MTQASESKTERELELEVDLANEREKTKALLAVATETLIKLETWGHERSALAEQFRLAIARAS